MGSRLDTVYQRLWPCPGQQGGYPPAFLRATGERLPRCERKNSMAGRRCGNQGGHRVMTATYLYQLLPEPSVEQASIGKGCVTSQDPPRTEKKLLPRTSRSFESKKTAGSTGCLRLHQDSSETNASPALDRLSGEKQQGL